MKLESTYFSKDLEKYFIGLSKTMFQEKVECTLLMPKMIGNMYCGSLYASLASLISQQGENLVSVGND